ncbi:MAG: nuclear transport factor 2 family protein [Gammaproteobacteria bacterium]|nr:MAG: nuclear transport factor 2 family protein [Gammaproteobacteria bacterium]
MTSQITQDNQLLSAAYTAFNARDIDAALALMTGDVTWPKAFKGGFALGRDEIRAYWSEQWSEINPHVEPTAFYPQNNSQVLVDVHQVVRDLSGFVLVDEHVGHLFTIKNDLIHAMEVCLLPASVLSV